MEILRNILTIGVTLHALFVTTKEAEWKTKHRPWVMVIGFLLAGGLIATTSIENSKSKAELATLNFQLVDALHSLDEKSNALANQVQKGHDLEREMLLLQKKASEAAELEKKKQAKIFEEKESARKKREANFVTPLNELVYQANGTIRMMNEPFLYYRVLSDGRFKMAWRYAGAFKETLPGRKNCH